MVAVIRFSVTQDKSKIQIAMASQGGSLRYYGVPIIPVNPTPMEVPNDASSSLVLTLQNLQAALNSRLLVYYGGSSTEYSSYETIDQVIASLMSDIGKADIVKGASIEELKQRLASRKAYARYYYEMFKGDNKTLENLDNSRDSEVKIVSQLVCFYFIKRLVHVFVMSTIFERVLMDMTPSVGTASASTSSYVSSSGSSTSSVGTDVAMAQLKEERARLEARGKELSNMMLNSNNVSSDGKLKQMTEKLNVFISEMKEKDNEIYRLNLIVNDLGSKVGNYRDLLLQSHDILFKIDEIPNILTN